MTSQSPLHQSQTNEKDLEDLCACSFCACATHECIAPQHQMEIRCCGFKLATGCLNSQSERVRLLAASAKYSGFSNPASTSTDDWPSSSRWSCCAIVAIASWYATASWYASSFKACNCTTALYTSSAKLWFCGLRTTISPSRAKKASIAVVRWPFCGLGWNS